MLLHLKIDQKSKPNIVSKSTLTGSFNWLLKCLIWVRINRENPSWRTTKFLPQTYGKDYIPVLSIWLYMTFQWSKCILIWPLYNILLLKLPSVSFYGNDKHFSLVPLDIASTETSGNKILFSNQKGKSKLLRTSTNKWRLSLQPLKDWRISWMEFSINLLSKMFHLVGWCLWWIKFLQKRLLPHWVLTEPRPGSTRWR